MALNVYTRVGDFSEDEASNKGGRSTVDTAQLDAELDAVKSVLDDARTKLAAIQRDDLKLNDDVLLGHEFSAAALSLLGGVLSTGTLVFRGEWATATAYAVRDVVSVTGTGAFICVTAHTAPGAFAASPNWQQLAADGAASVSRRVVAVSSDIAIDASHNNKTLETTGVRTLTLPLASSMTDGFAITVAPASGSATLTRSGTETIDGATSVAVAYSAQGTRAVTLQVNAARNGWRVVEHKGAGSAGAFATWNGAQMGEVAPTAKFQSLIADSASAASFQGGEVPSNKTANYTVVAGDHRDIIMCDASAGAFILTLPDSAAVGRGFVITFIKYDTTANIISVSAAGYSIANFGTTLNLRVAYEFVTLISNGSGWMIIENGLKTLFGSNTLNLAAGAIGTFSVSHGFESDDVDFGAVVLNNAPGNNYALWSLHICSPNNYNVSLHGGAEPTTVPVAITPAAGIINFAVRNNYTATANVTVKYWIRRRYV